MHIDLRFTSELNIPPAQVWQWITDVQLLREEMAPWLWMSVPKGLNSLADVQVEPGQVLFTSWLWLFGFLPLGTSRLTLLTMEPGLGFVEQSPMTGMRLWRHERRLEDLPGGTRITDTLRVEALLPAFIVRPFLTLFFRSRHRALRSRAARLSS